MKLRSPRQICTVSEMRRTHGRFIAAAIAAASRYGRPAWTHLQIGRCEFCEFVRGVNHLPANDGEHRFQIFDLLFRN